jgi:hypothetical protein
LFQIVCLLGSWPMFDIGRCQDLPYLIFIIIRCTATVHELAFDCENLSGGKQHVP